jgi:hypothetical protein
MSKRNTTFTFDRLNAASMQSPSNNHGVQSLSSFNVFNTQNNRFAKFDVASFKHEGKSSVHETKVPKVRFLLESPNDQRSSML